MVESKHECDSGHGAKLSIMPRVLYRCRVIGVDGVALKLLQQVRVNVELRVPMHEGFDGAWRVRDRRLPVGVCMPNTGIRISSITWSSGLISLDVLGTNTSSNGRWT